MRNADAKFDDLDAALNFALRIGKRLAVLARQNRCKPLLLPPDDIDEFHQHTGSALRIDRRPFALRRSGIGDRLATSSRLASGTREIAAPVIGS